MLTILTPHLSSPLPLPKKKKKITFSHQKWTQSSDALITAAGAGGCPCAVTREEEGTTFQAIYTLLLSQLLTVLVSIPRSCPRTTFTAPSLAPSSMGKGRQTGTALLSFSSMAGGAPPMRMITQTKPLLGTGMRSATIYRKLYSPSPFLPRYVLLLFHIVAITNLSWGVLWSLNLSRTQGTILSIPSFECNKGKPPMSSFPSAALLVVFYTGF